MQKLQIKRAKNLWVRYIENFCTPLAVWEVDLEELDKLISIDVRKQIARYLKYIEFDHSASVAINRLLLLTAVKLQSCDSDETFAWLMNVNSRISDERFCYPFLDDKAAAAVGPMTINFLLKANSILLRIKDPDFAIKQVLNLFRSFKRKISQIIPYHSSFRLLIEAKKRSIPTMRHSDQPSYQLGYGAKRKLISRGYTNYTSKLATSIATHKFLASSLLSQAGIPTPRYVVVKTFEEAKAATKHIRFPLVVKPTSTDKGIGVTVGVENNEDLKFAWSQAAPYGNVLIEQMLQGFDYRLHVVDGKCIYVVKRTPPYVVGNGRDTIEKLLDISNQKRSKTPEYRKFSNATCNDPAILEYLKKQGLSRTSVLSKNQLVYLRSNANVSTGGFFDEVTNECHQDNIILAERASRLIGLDNAGVDLITTDITKSWINTDAGICEVNPTPAFGKEISVKIIMDYLFPCNANGQIKIILYVGDSKLLRKYHENLIENNPSIADSSALIFDKKLHLSSKSGMSVFPGKTTQELINGAIFDPMIEFLAIQIDFNEINEGINLHYLSSIVAVGDEEEIDLLMKSDLISRCDHNTILVNPSVPHFLKTIVSLLQD